MNSSAGLPDDFYHTLSYVLGVKEIYYCVGFVGLAELKGVNSAL